jgi:hypothetical protein
MKDKVGTHSRYNIERFTDACYKRFARKHPLHGLRICRLYIHPAAALQTLEKSDHFHIAAGGGHPLNMNDGSSAGIEVFRERFKAEIDRLEAVGE